MKRIKVTLTNGLFILTLYLVIILSVLVFAEMQSVEAETYYLPLESAPGEQVSATLAPDSPFERDISRQRLAPVDTDQLPGSGFWK